MESQKGIYLSTSNTSNLSQDRDEDSAKRSRFSVEADPDFEYEISRDPQIDDEFRNINSGIVESENLLNNFVPLSSLPSVEAVFSIPKILENIFHYCGPKDLFRFRLVSRHWRREATNDMLLNWASNKIRIERNHSDEQLLACHYRQDRKFSKPLSEWTQLMNQTGSNTFPCTQFHITCDNKEEDDEEVLATFLNNHGRRIKYLCFSLLYYKRWDEILDANTLCSHRENWFHGLITRLLVEQAPNLEWIKFEFNSDTWQKMSGIPLVNDNNTQRKEDTVGRLDLKLHTVSFLHNVPKSIFELVCRLIPNLKTLNAYDLSHYIEPINRLHLLTSLTYRPGSWRPEWNSIVERIANLNGELKVTELFIFTADIRQRPDDWLRVADICNKLLTNCARRLKKLTWSRMGFLRGLKTPEMSNVNYLTLSGGGSISSEIKFFPRGMRISEAFPKLHTIRLSCNDSEIAALGHELLSGSGCDEHCVPSVKVVNKFGRSIDLDVFERAFPNARFVDSD